MTDRLVALRVLAALRQTPVGDTAVLVGSSGLFAFDTRVPALTEDLSASSATPARPRRSRRAAARSRPPPS